MNFPVFTQLAGNFRFPETGSLETASSCGESANFRSLARCRDPNVPFGPAPGEDLGHQGENSPKCKWQRYKPRASPNQIGDGVGPVLYIGLAGRFRLPTVYPLRDYVEAGGLLSYGAVLRDKSAIRWMSVSDALMRRWPSMRGKWLAGMRCGSNGRRRGLKQFSMSMTGRALAECLRSMHWGFVYIDHSELGNRRAPLAPSGPVSRRSRLR